MKLSHADPNELKALFDSPDSEKLLFDKFGYNQFTLKNIPSNARHRVMNELLQQDIGKLEDNLRGMVKDYDQLLEYSFRN